MGAKDTVKFNLRRKPAFKCEECPLKFSTLPARTKHIYSAHRKEKGKKNELNTLLGKSVKPSPAAVKNAEDSELVLEVEPAKTSDVAKIQYECPQCSQCFSVYFSAFRHIQKNHCINNEGVKVPLNSLDIIKPVRIEICMKCNQRLRPNEVHSCLDVGMNIDPIATFICTGCNQKFGTLKLFDMHVTGVHCDDVETLFFPCRNTFESWKSDLESQSKVKYLILDKTRHVKQVYNCTFLTSQETDSDADVIHFCPSSIVVRDFTKCVQVHYYKQHFDHDTKYTLPEEFHKYRSMELLKEPSPITEPYEIKNLQVDFKTITDYLVSASFKCDKTTLEALNQKAQEMLTIVNGADPPRAIKRNLTDDQISETLESLDMKKKKMTGLESNAETPVIVNAFSLTGNSDDKIKVKLNDEVASVNFSSPSSSKSSFNDSYKEFVDKNFKPKSELPKNNETENQSKPSNIQRNIVNKPTKGRSKKKIMKTKIGQFKPSLSPRKDEVVSMDRRNSSGKIDFDYEVREQENDCNILVLKI